MTVTALFGVWVIALLGTAWRAYVLTILWRWFVSPAFDLPTLSFWAMWGLMLTACLFYARFDGQKVESEQVTRALTETFIGPLYLLATAALVYWAGT